MARRRRLDGDGGRLRVAHLAHEDRVGILPQHRAEPVGEYQVGRVVELHLCRVGQAVLHRILERDDGDERIDLPDRLQATPRMRA